MSLPRPPKLEPRRFADFQAELLARAKSWIPDWSLDESEGDFGRACACAEDTLGASSTSSATAKPNRHRSELAVARS